MAQGLDAATTRIAKYRERPLRAAFLARGMNALARLAELLDERRLSDATGAISDFQVLLFALEDPGVLELLRSDDPLAGARLRGLRAKTELIEAEGGSLGVDDVAELLRISRQAVDKRRRAGKLLGVQAGRRGYAYPAWQFAANGTLPGLEAVLGELSEHDAWMKVAFFLSENARLEGRRPLDGLREGETARVRQAARAYGEHGAA
ncbi:MAG: hypothetical protein KC609_20530 [Myxococcales bacterium]|nr:hypothetical protein [Myxococcales bacterium]